MPRPLPPPSAAAIHWSLDPEVVFLNHGSFGATPRAILERQNEFRALLEREPVRFFVDLREGLLDESRRALSAFLNADPEGLVFMPNATAGVNTVLHALNLQPGDELLTNGHEYNACNNALRFIAERARAKVVYADLPFPFPPDLHAAEDQIVAAVLAAVTPRTRLAMLSHVTSPSGVILPIPRLVRELAAKGVDALVDGAHAPGMIPLDLTAINAAYYTGNLHKWLFAPKGAAFLHARADRRGHLHPLVISHGYNSPRTDRSRFRLEFDYTGTDDPSPILCIPAAIEFLKALDPSGQGDPQGLMRRNHDLALQGRALLCAKIKPAAAPIAPPEMLGSLAAAVLPIPKSGLKPGKRHHDALQEILIAQHRVQVPIVPFMPRANQPARVVRIAAQMYNAIEQVAYLADVLGEELAKEK